MNLLKFPQLHAKAQVYIHHKLQRETRCRYTTHLNAVRSLYVHTPQTALLYCLLEFNIYIYIYIYIWVRLRLKKRVWGEGLGFWIIRALCRCRCYCCSNKTTDYQCIIYACKCMQMHACMHACMHGAYRYVWVEHLRAASEEAAAAVYFSPILAAVAAASRAVHTPQKKNIHLKGRD